MPHTVIYPAVTEDLQNLTGVNPPATHLVGNLAPTVSLPSVSLIRWIPI
jgi:hypothetical protein